VWVLTNRVTVQQLPNRPNVWIKHGDSLVPKGRVVRDRVSVRQPDLEFSVFAPPLQLMSVDINDEGLYTGWKGGRIDLWSGPLRRGTNYLRVHAERWQQAETPAYSLNEPVSLILYQPPEPLPPVIAGVDRSRPEYTDIYGFAEPGMELSILGGSFSTASVSVNEIGLFRATLFGDSALTDTLRYAYSDRYSPVSDSIQFSPFLSAPRAGLLTRAIVIHLDSLEFDATMTAEVAEGTVLFEWLENWQIDTREFVARVFGVGTSFDNPGEMWDPVAHIVGDPFVTTVGEGRQRVEFQFEGKVSNYGIAFGEFRAPPFTQGDSLVLTVTDRSRISIIQQPTERRDESTYIWRGAEVDYTRPVLFIETSLINGVREYDEEPEVGPPLVAAQPSTPDSKTIVELMDGMKSRLPKTVQQILNALLGAIPLIWLMVILRKGGHVKGGGYPATLFAVTATFLVYHITILSFPLFSWFLESANYLIFNNLYGEPGFFRAVDELSVVYPFLVIGIMFLMRPIFAATRQRIWGVSLGRRVLWQVLRWVVFWPIALVLPLVMVAMVMSAPTGLEWSEWWRSGDAAFPLVALVLGLVFFWFFLYWAMRIMLRRPVRLRSTLLASWAMLVFPLLPSIATQASVLLRELVVEKWNIYPFFLPIRLEQTVWLLVIVLVGVSLLHQLTYLSLRLSQWGHGRRLYQSRFKWAAWAIFLICCIPAGLVFGGSDYVQSNLLIALGYQIDDLLTMTIIIGMLVFIRRMNPDDSFELHKDIENVGALIFAFYLAGRASSLLYVPIPLILGWLMFRYWVLDPAGWAAQTLIQRPQKTVAKIIAYKRASRLTQALKKSLEKKYSDGQLDRAAFEQKSADRVKYLEDKKKQLPDDRGVAKRAVFARGSENGPWENAMIAVKYGLFLSILFQIQTFKGLMDRSAGREFQFLDVANNFLYSMSTWLLIAFVFGYFFHRIRGNDGLTKSLVFAAALFVPTIPQRFIFDAGVFTRGHFIQTVQIVSYVLALALIAFDWRTIRRLGYGWQDLLVVHGMRSVVTYASTIVLTTAASLGGQSVRELLTSVFKGLFGGQ
jgi:hypothetical protein